jgi:hypothetical protein
MEELRRKNATATKSTVARPRVEPTAEQKRLLTADIGDLL